jgi:hypothetical protein
MVLVMSLRYELFISIQQSHWKQSFFGVCALGASAPNSYILFDGTCPPASCAAPFRAVRCALSLPRRFQAAWFPSPIFRAAWFDHRPSSFVSAPCAFGAPYPFSG